MSTTELDLVFASALRDALVAHVEGTSRRRRRWRWRLGIGVFAGGAALAGGAAVAASLLTGPGGTVNTPLGSVVTVSRTGTATVDLGSAPNGATGISWTFTCLSAGTFVFTHGAGVNCGGKTVGSKSSYVQPLQPGQTSITITTSPTASWSLKAVYVNSVVTPWATNANGETYGAINTKGTPDLVLVEVEGNKGRGYVKSSDLACASGTDYVHDPSEAVTWTKASQGRSVAIPAYTSNGTTVIGTFVVGSEGPGIRIVPLSTVAKRFCQTTAQSSP